MRFGEKFHRHVACFGAVLFFFNVSWKLPAATWEWQAARSTFAPYERQAHSAVWTGNKLLIWGGRVTQFDGTNTATGGFYDPQTSSWTPTITNGAPVPRSRHITVWTGSKMIVWGGLGPGLTSTRRDGGVFDTDSSTWHPVSTNNSPLGRSDATAVWTGNHLLVWGGILGTNYRNDGGRYHLATDSWLPMSSSNAPTPRSRAITGWTGNRMLVWGGGNGTNRLTDGALYDPASDVWSPISPTNAPTAISPLVGVWTGSRMIVWTSTNSFGVAEGAIYDPSADSWQSISTNGGFSGVAGAQTAVAWNGTEFYICDARNGEGARYNPTTDSWTPINMFVVNPSIISLSGFSATWAGTGLIIFGGNSLPPSSPIPGVGRLYSPTTGSWIDLLKSIPTRSFAPAAWTGSNWLAWGGDRIAVINTLDSGFIHDPFSDKTQLIPSGPNDPSARRQNSVVWTGSEFLVWGGINLVGPLKSGSRYNPATASWSTMATPTQSLMDRSRHTAIWTGTEMIIWGGVRQGTAVGRGAIYNPASDSWRTNSGLPSGRIWHSAIWTGTQMLVWGGTSSEFNGPAFNHGGVFMPATDHWEPISLTNAPAGRYRHTAVWTGTNMIVWGGWDGTNYFSDGGIYDPITSNWTAIATLNAPSARYDQSAIWTGTEMIVWGGKTASGETNDGAHYNPDTDTWTSITANNLPPVRAGHSATWTGTHMLIFGGYAGVQDKNDIFRYGPNPYSGDATDDVWQTFHFGPNNPQGAGGMDADGDGWSNEFEFVAGLNPTNALSTFSLSISQPGNSPELSFGPVFTNRVYELIASPDLSTGVWTNVVPSATNNVGFTRTLTDNTSSTNQNYRIRITLP